MVTENSRNPVEVLSCISHQDWAAPLLHFSSGVRPWSLRWGRTRELMELTSCSRAFLREGRLPALLRMYSSDLGREGGSLGGQVLLEAGRVLWVQQTEQLLAQPSQSAPGVKSPSGDIAVRVWQMWIPTTR